MLKLTLLEKLFFACICTHFAVLSAAKVILFNDIRCKMEKEILHDSEMKGDFYARSG